MPIPYTITEIIAASVKAGGKFSVPFGTATAPVPPKDETVVLFRIWEMFMSELGYTSEILRNVELEKSVSSQWLRDRNKALGDAMADSAQMGAESYAQIVVSGRSPTLTETHCKALAMTYLEGRMMVVNDKWPVSIAQSIFGGGVAMQGPAGDIARANKLA